MTTSTFTVNALIRRHEDRRYKVYDDATGKPIVPGTLCKGHPTIGEGRELDGNGLSDTEIDFLKANDIDLCRKDLEYLLGDAYRNAGPVRQGALIDMRFTFGHAKFRAFSHMINSVIVGDWEGAAEQALDSDWARLEDPQRAAEDALMLKTGDPPPWAAGQGAAPPAAA